MQAANKRFLHQRPVDDKFLPLGSRIEKLWAGLVSNGLKDHVYQMRCMVKHRAAQNNLEGWRRKHKCLAALSQILRLTIPKVMIWVSNQIFNPLKTRALSSLPQCGPTCHSLQAAVVMPTDIYRISVFLDNMDARVAKLGMMRSADNSSVFLH